MRHIGLCKLGRIFFFIVFVFVNRVTAGLQGRTGLQSSTKQRSLTLILHLSLWRKVARFLSSVPFIKSQVCKLCAVYIVVHVKQ